MAAYKPNFAHRKQSCIMVAFKVLILKVASLKYFRDVLVWTVIQADKISRVEVF